MRKAREHAGLKQSELAAEIGIGRTSVTHYETSQKDAPRLVLLAWAFRCGVPLDWLRYGDSHSTTPGGAPAQHSTVRPLRSLRAIGPSHADYRLVA